MTTEKIIYENPSNLKLKNINWPRIASRGIVKTPDGNILVFFKAKTGQYKLPGGGKEGNEIPKETFVREVLEETGHTIKNIQYLGITKDATQISHIFIADADKDTKNFNPDAAEIAEGADFLILDPQEVLEKMQKFLKKYADRNDEDSLIKTAITSRDYNILKYCLDKKLL